MQGSRAVSVDGWKHFSVPAACQLPAGAGEPRTRSSQPGEYSAGDRAIGGGSHPSREANLGKHRSRPSPCYRLQSHLA